MVKLHDEVQRWLQASLGDQFKLTEVEKLLGGISSSMYAVHGIEQASAKRTAYVMRVVLPTDFLTEDVGILEREAATLRKLASLPQLAAHWQNKAGAGAMLSPYCIDYDATGAEAGYPALLMSLLPGKVDLPQQPGEAWLTDLAQAIAPLHQVTSGLTEFPWRYERYASDDLVRQHSALHWSRQPECWNELIEHALQPAPVYTPCFIHRDYHPTNVLWDEQQRVAGIVDWVNGCIGPAAIDVGHCRMNLVQMYGVEAANTFLAAYRKANPTFKYDPYWDIISLFDMTAFGDIDVYEGWTALGFQGLTAQIIQDRIEQYATYLLQLLHTNRNGK